MALANVAYVLATKPLYSGKKVLMIDWDLEAPGLYRYFEEDFETKALGSYRSRDQRLEKTRGLLEYLEAAARIYEEHFPSSKLSYEKADTPEAASAYEEVRRVSGFDEQFLLQVGNNENLTLLKAGYEDDTYPHRVRAFDWEMFYKKYGSFFAHFRQHLTSKFQYVFIDSRTGLTDTSGICTRVMPEKLVGVFAPNWQNLEGLKGVISRALAHRRDSRDPRGLMVFPLASRIDAAASKLRKTWWKGGHVAGKEVVGYEKIFEDLFVDIYELDNCNLHEYFDSTQIPHDSDYAYGEEIAARYDLGTSDKLSIATACTNLADRLVMLEAPWETLPEDAKLAEAQRHAEEAKVIAEELGKREHRSRKIAIATVLAALLVVAVGVSWALWQRQLRLRAQTEAAERALQAEKYNNAGAVDLQNDNYQSALQNFSEAIKLKPDYTEAYLNRARLYTETRESELAMSDYAQAIKLKPDLAVAYKERAELFLGKDEYDLALVDYNSAISINPDDWNTYLARGGLHEDKQEYTMAIDDFTRVINSNAEQLKASAYLHRGMNYQRLGSKEQAIDDLLKIPRLSRNPLFRYRTTKILDELGYRNSIPETYVPRTLSVFLIYESESDGTVIDVISDRLRETGFTVQPKERFFVSLRDTGVAEVAYYSNSQQAKSDAEKVQAIVMRTIVEKGYPAFAPKVNYRGQVDPYVPRGNIEVWIPSLARVQQPRVTIR